MDEKLFLKMYGLASKNKKISWMAGTIANFSARFFAALYGVLILNLIIEKENLILIKVILVPLITIIFNMTLRRIIKRKRPFEYFNIKPLVKHGKAFSFPSNHTASAMIIAMAVLYVNIQTGCFAVALAVIAGISRIFSGLHYPSDVAAGLFLSLFFGLIGFAK